MHGVRKYYWGSRVKSPRESPAGFLRYSQKSERPSILKMKIIYSHISLIISLIWPHFQTTCYLFGSLDISTCFYCKWQTFRPLWCRNDAVFTKNTSKFAFKLNYALSLKESHELSIQPTALKIYQKLP